MPSVRRLGSCRSAILVDESAEYWSSVDSSCQVDYPAWLVGGCLLLPALVWAMVVVMRLPIGEYATQMSLVDDQKMI